MELFDGHLYVHLNLGTGAAKVRASRKQLNDGDWHRVELTLKDKVGRITVDGTTEAFETPGNQPISHSPHQYCRGESCQLSFNWALLPNARNEQIWIYPNIFG